jgi:hypothetical protein
MQLLNKILLCLLVACFTTLAAAQPNPCDRYNIPYNSVPGDTTVVYPQGTRITFNRCEFFDIRECLTVTEAFSLEAVQAAGFTTQTEKGGLLVTGGMLKIELSPACNGRTTFEVPVIVEMPLLGPQGSCAVTDSNRYRLYTTTNSLWSDTNKIEVKKTIINGRKFIRFIMNGAFGVNWDMPMKTTKIKFKTKNLPQLYQVSVSTDCPLTMVHFYPKRNKRKVIVRLPCTGNQVNVYIAAKGLNKDGDTVTKASTPLNMINHGSSMKNCKASRVKAPVIKRILGIFPVRRGAVYRKYFIE